MLFHYFHMWRRERYMVTHLHENYIHSRVNLKDVVHDYPTVEKKMMYFNQLVLTTTLISICFQSVNIVISGVFLFGTQYYSGFKTATSFIANILLIVSLLWNAFNSSYVSKKHKLAYSCVACKYFLSFVKYCKKLTIFYYRVFFLCFYRYSSFLQHSG